MSLSAFDTLTHGAWQVRIAVWARQWAPQLEKVLQQCSRPVQVLRRDSHSIILLCAALHGAPTGPWVVKRPVAKDTSAWIRLTTWYRAGEAQRVFTRALKLWDAGLPVPRPILQMERRCFGMIVESWFVYCYESGQRCSGRHLPQVIAILDRLHRLGYTHGDPHPLNWVQHDARVVALDLSPRRAWPHGFWVAYDYVLLRRHAPQIPRSSQVKRPYWWAATLYYRWICRWRLIKKMLPRQRGSRHAQTNVLGG